MRQYDETIIIHDNVDVDAIVSAFIYAEMLRTQGILSVDVITKSEAEKFDIKEAIVLDMPVPKNIKAKHHLDHHSKENSHFRSTAEAIQSVFCLPKHLKYLVELANCCDQAEVIKQKNPIKLFHISGYINALRQAGHNDKEIINKIFVMLHQYMPMLKTLAEAESQAGQIKIKSVYGTKYAVAESTNTSINQILFEKGADIIIYKDGNNIGYLRNAETQEPNLNLLKLDLSAKLKSKNKSEEFKEWFFHPNGFIACRGSRKHPAKTPSVLSLKDLEEILIEALTPDEVIV